MATAKLGYNLYSNLSEDVDSMSFIPSEGRVASVSLSKEGVASVCQSQ